MKLTDELILKSENDDRNCDIFNLSKDILRIIY